MIPAQPCSTARISAGSSIAIASRPPQRRPTSSTPMRGSHTLKFGGELLLEQSWEGYQQQWGGNMDLIYNNGKSSQVVFGPPLRAAKSAACPRMTV